MTGRRAAAALALAAAAAGALLLRPDRGVSPFERAMTETSRGAFFQEDGATVRGTRLFPSPLEFSRAKPPGVKRVFIVGESAAAEFGAENALPLPEVLGRLYSGPRFEVLNLGVPGYDSARALAVARAAAAYSPDLLLVMSGNNEYYQDSSWLDRVPGLNGSAALKRALERLFRRRSPDYAERMRRYEANLRAIAQTARGAGAAAAFCTLPANAADYPPDARASLAWRNADFAAGMLALERGRLRTADTRLAAAAKALPSDALPAFWHGRVMTARGRWDEARADYLRALELDSRPGSRSPDSRAALVRAAAAQEGAVLIDLAAAFSARAQHGALGAEVMLNGVHWHRRLNPAASTTMARALEQAGLWKQSLAPEAARRAAWRALDARVAAAAADRAALPASYWRQALCRYALLDQPEWHDPTVAVFQTIARGGGGELRSLESFAAYRAALEPLSCRAPGESDQALKGKWPGVLAHGGEAYRRLDRRRDAWALFGAARREGYATPALWRSLTLLADRDGDAAAREASLQELSARDAEEAAALRTALAEKEESAR